MLSLECSLVQFWVHSSSQCQNYLKLYSVAGIVSHYLYADDTQIYITITPVQVTGLLDHLRTVDDLKQGQMQSYRKNCKTELMLVVPNCNSRISPIYFPSIFLVKTFYSTNKAKNRRVLFDSDHSLGQHISYHIREFESEST